MDEDGTAAHLLEDKERGAEVNSPTIDAKTKNKQVRNNIYKLLLTDWRVKLTLLPSFLLGALSALYFIVFAPFITELSKLASDNSYDPMPKIKMLVVYATFIAFGNGITKFIDTFCWMQAGSALSVKLRKDLFDNMMRCDISFFDNNPIGSLITIMSQDAATVQNAFGTTKGDQLRAFGAFTMSLVYCFVFSWKIGALFTTCMIVLTIIVVGLNPIILRVFKKKFEYSSLMMTIAHESFSFIRTLRSYNQEDRMFSKFKDQSSECRSMEVKASNRNIFRNIFILITDDVFYLGIFYFAATLVGAEIEIGDLFSIHGFFNIQINALGVMLFTLLNENQAVASGARILEMTNYKPELPYEGGIQIKDFKGNIEFRNVSFKYPTRDVMVLKNVSFEVKAGQIAALVGHSGSGKSTCIHLLERFYDVTEGSIYLDGINIKELDPRWLHQKMALVSQEPALFRASIRENIIYGSRDATQSEIENAAKISNSTRFINKCPCGYDELLGEKGITLSGGQKQRIAIARAVLKNPVILLTDEATSALDAGNEKIVQDALDEVMKNRTSIVVAHRLSTIKNAQIIYVFDSGEIKEFGTHDQLISLKGVYYNLVERQLDNEMDYKAKDLDVKV